MIEVTINTFINTLIDAISSSPTTFVTLIAGIIFLIAMLISLKKHKKMGKTLFIIGWLFIILFINNWKIICKFKQFGKINRYNRKI